MSGGPQCPHSLALQPRYLHGCSSAALCTSGLGVHGEWLAEQSMKPRMSPAEPAPSTQTPQLLCPPRQQVLGIALTENHGTDVDIPENIFRKEDRATFTLPVPLLPSGRLHPISSSLLHPLASLCSWLGKVLPVFEHPGRGAPGKPCPQEQQQRASKASARWKDISLGF